LIPLIEIVSETRTIKHNNIKYENNKTEWWLYNKIVGYRQREKEWVRVLSTILANIEISNRMGTKLM
jgi:hypothetical protein